MRILILGLNHEPEPVGIAPYTSEMARWLAAAGHAVEIVAAKPYYPGWIRAPEYAGLGYARSSEAGVRIVRCPLYVPRRPTGLRRIVHHLSFLAAAVPAMIAAVVRRRPQLVITIAPSLATVPLARVAALLAGAKAWLHVQDFEVGAALATGLLAADSLAGRAAAAFEALAFAGFDRYSSISPQMCERLAAMGIGRERIVEFRNWADVGAIVPLDRPSAFRALWGIGTPHVALYSGNVANKQGVGIIVEAARLLRHRTDLTFVICGEGPTLAALAEAAADLANVQIHPLQPRDRLGELLGLASVHLLPQLEGAADLVLPSKLTNMLASGRAVVATAAPGTGLADEVAGCGAVTPPGDAAAMAGAIAALIDDAGALHAAGAAARARAEERWSRREILGRFEAQVRALAGGAGARPDEP